MAAHTGDARAGHGRCLSAFHWSSDKIGEMLPHMRARLYSTRKGQLTRETPEPLSRAQRRWPMTLLD